MCHILTRSIESTKKFENCWLSKNDAEQAFARRVGDLWMASLFSIHWMNYCVSTFERVVPFSAMLELWPSHFFPECPGDQSPSSAGQYNAHAAMSNTVET